MAFLQADEINFFCSIIQRSSHWLQRHSIARATIENSFRQVFNIWGE